MILAKKYKHVFIDLLYLSIYLDKLKESIENNQQVLWSFNKKQANDPIQIKNKQILLSLHKNNTNRYNKLKRVFNRELERVMYVLIV